MNNNFILFDKKNNVEKKAQFVVKFDFEGNNYIVYSIDENEQNCQIFVSKLILNSEGIYFIDEITSDEKGKLSNIVYNIVILVPSDIDKGIEFQTLINNLFDKFSVKLLSGLPVLSRQEYYSNCSIAITSKILVESAVKLYEEKLNVVKEDSSVEVPMWTAPMEVTSPISVDDSLPSVSEPVVVSNTVPVQETVSIVSPIPVEETVTPILNDEKKIEVAPTINENTIKTSVSDVVSDHVIPVEMDKSNLLEKQSIVSESVSYNDGQMPNPQLEKIAIVSDPSLGIGVTQPNVMNNKKAGFANTKYVVIGTICLVLAIAVIVAAYFLIKNIS